jgi:hypothetical protein
MLAPLAHSDLSVPAFTTKGVIENADEEGDVVEPAPVPKKTIIKKKIVTAKK